jgi:hypothetical protein
MSMCPLSPPSSEPDQPKVISRPEDLQGYSNLAGDRGSLDLLQYGDAIDVVIYVEHNFPPVLANDIEFNAAVVAKVTAGLGGKVHQPSLGPEVYPSEFECISGVDPQVLFRIALQSLVPDVSDPFNNGAWVGRLAEQRVNHVVAEGDKDDKFDPEDAHALEVRFHKVRRWLAHDVKNARKVTLLSPECVEAGLERMSKKIQNPHAHQGISKFLGKYTTVDEMEDIARGLILYGPPGTGKTAYIKPIVDCGFELIDLIEGCQARKGLVGSASKYLHQLFDRAQALPWMPMLLAIDGMEVGFSNLPSDAENISVLLTRVHGARDQTNVVLLGCVNSVDELDPAVLSRMSHQVYVGYVGLQSRWNHISSQVWGADLSKKCRDNVILSRNIQILSRHVREISRNI